MDIDWHSGWANYLVQHRDLKNWERYAEETAELEVDRAWSILEFYRDPSELMVSDDAIEAHAEDQAAFIFIHGGLRLFGVEMWEKYRDQADVSRKETAAWKRTYTGTYRERVDEMIDRLIPDEIRDDLPFFCKIVSGLRAAVDYGEAPPRRPFGLRLGDEEVPKGRRKGREEPKIVPSRREILSVAARAGREQAEAAWKGAEHGDGRIGFARREGRYGMFPPFEWELSEADRTLFGKTQTDAYLEVLEDKLHRFAPPEAWRNASLICLVYGRMSEQGVFKVKKGEKAGFDAWSSRRESMLRKEREKWEQEMMERAEREKKREEEMRERQKQAKKKGR